MKKKNTADAKWMMEKFFRLYQIDAAMYPTAKAKISDANNLVITLPHGIIVYNPQAGIVLNDTTGLIIRAKNWRSDLFSLSQQANDPEFLQSLVWSEYIRSIRIYEDTNGIWYCAEFINDSPVDGETHFLMKQTRKQRVIEKIALETIASTCFVSKLSATESMKAAEAINQVFFEMKQRVEPLLPYAKTQQSQIGVLAEKDWNLIRMFKRGMLCASVDACQQRFTTGKRIVTIMMQPLSFTYDFTTGEADFTESCRKKLETILSKLQLLQKYTEPYNNFRTFAIQALGTFAQYAFFSIAVGKKDEGDVVFCVNLTYPGTSVQARISPRAVKTGVRKLVADAKKSKKESNRIAAEKLHNLECEAMKMQCYGNFLAKSVYWLIDLNQKHITENVVVQILRGTSIRSDFVYKYGTEYGVYKILDKDTIADAIEILIQDKLIERQMVKGEYGHYYRLKVCKDNRALPLLQLKAHNYGKNKRYALYTDADWAQYLVNTDPALLKESDWKKILPLLNHSNVYCKCREEYVAFFASAPDSIKAYIDAQQGIEDGVQKKFLKTLYQEITSQLM